MKYMAAETKRYVQAVLAHLADNIPKVRPRQPPSFAQNIPMVHPQHPQGFLMALPW